MQSIGFLSVISITKFTKLLSSLFDSSCSDERYSWDIDDLQHSDNLALIEVCLLRVFLFCPSIFLYVPYSIFVQPLHQCATILKPSRPDLGCQSTTRYTDTTSVLKSETSSNMQSAQQRRITDDEY